MPELPEVETVCKGLAPVMEGRKFTSIVLNRPDLRFVFPDNFIGRLRGTTLVRLSRRAKFLVANLSSGETLLMHLGMSGRFTIDAQNQPASNGAPNPKHDHVIFKMSGKGTPTITYNDSRRFGFMELLPKNDTGRMQGLGPEPLSNQFSGPVLHRAMQNKSMPIKSALLDQRIVAGLGNIYVCEALYDAKISPLKKSSALYEDQYERLSREIKNTLERAIKAGGSTLKDFAAADGGLGYFQHQFKVYGHEGKNCLDAQCGGEIIRIKQSGRSTFYCPECQA